MSNGGRRRYDDQELVTIGDQIRTIPLLTVFSTDGQTGLTTSHAFLLFAGHLSTIITMCTQRRKMMGRNSVTRTVNCVVPSPVEYSDNIALKSNENEVFLLSARFLFTATNSLGSISHFAFPSLNVDTESSLGP